MEKNEILMIHGKDYKEMTKRLLREAELDTRIPDRRCRIGIKPNLVSPQRLPTGLPHTRRSLPGFWNICRRETMKTW